MFNKNCVVKNNFNILTVRCEKQVLLLKQLLSILMLLSFNYYELLRPARAHKLIFH